jgi:tetratricopeptide (TPR) repeat protein
MSQPNSAGLAANIAADDPRLGAVEDAARAGDVERAAALADELMAMGVRHPLVFNLASLRLERRGSVGEALNTLRQALAMAPDDLGLRLALGLCLMRAEDAEAALAEFDAVIAAAPGLAPAHVNRGWALHMLSRPDLAEASFRHGLALEPGNVAGKAGLAAVQTLRGSHKEARQLAQDVVERQPGYPQAVLSLAAADIAENAAPDAERRLRALVNEGRADAVEQARAVAPWRCARCAAALRRCVQRLCGCGARAEGALCAVLRESRERARRCCLAEQLFRSRAPPIVGARRVHARAAAGG